VGSPETEAWRHRSLVASAARTGRRGGLVRIAAEAAELRRPAARRALLDAVDAALGRWRAARHLPRPGVHDHPALRLATRLARLVRLTRLTCAPG